MIREVLYITQQAQTWIHDSGATFHVILNIEWFPNYSVGANGTIRLGNGQECTIAWIGDVLIQLTNDNTITIHQL